jgi:hypothetical protein
VTNVSGISRSVDISVFMGLILVIIVFRNGLLAERPDNCLMVKADSNQFNNPQGFMLMQLAIYL